MKISALCLAFLLAAPLSGCGMKSMAPSAGKGYVVKDATGNEVKIPKKPERILGNSASIDTMLLSVVTKDKLVAATEADRDPAISYVKSAFCRVRTVRHSLRAVRRRFFP